MKIFLNGKHDRVHTNKGFTLIELIVVIAILAALMLILVPTMNGFVNTAKKEANQANAKSVYNALVASGTAKSAGLTLTPITVLADNFCTGTADVYTEFWSGKKVKDCTFTGDILTGFVVTVGASGLTETYPNS